MSQKYAFLCYVYVEYLVEIMEKMTKIGIVENNHAYFLIYGYYFISVYLISSLSLYSRFSPPIPQMKV